MNVALTGGIGSGKSTALDIFKDLGAHIQDCDWVVTDIYKRCVEFKESLLERFGASIEQNGLIDKKAIAKIVFNNKEELSWLNEQLHSRVRKQVWDNLSSDKINIVAVPLLHESSWHESFDKAICVWCPNELRITRLQNRAFTEKEAQERIDAQMDQDKKLELSDFGIVNDSDKEDLYHQCQLIFNRLNK